MGFYIDQENVVGHQGIRLQAKVQNGLGELDTDVNAVSKPRGMPGVVR